MGTGSADIETWAQGNDISFQTAMRSDPSFIELYLQGVRRRRRTKYDTYVATQLLAAAGAATLPTTLTFVNCVKALYAKLNPATTPPGPLFLAMSYDLFGRLIGVTGLNGPAFWNVSMSTSATDPRACPAGLNMFVDPNLAGRRRCCSARSPRPPPTAARRRPPTSVSSTCRCSATTSGSTSSPPWRSRTRQRSPSSPDIVPVGDDAPAAAASSSSKSK